VDDDDDVEAVTVLGIISAKRLSIVSSFVDEEIIEICGVAVDVVVVSL
jgi:hypothetical protein